MVEQGPAFEFLATYLKTKEFEQIPLEGDASTRRYFRVLHQNQSFVLMCDEPFEDTKNHSFLNTQIYFSEHQVKVPQVFHVLPSKGFILLEDLGDLTLERKFKTCADPQEALPFYQKAIDELIKIQFLNSKDAQKCLAFNVAFDQKKFLWEMNYARQHFLEQFCGISFSDDISEKLNFIFEDVCKQLSKEPQYICHRDYHSRNLMVQGDSLRVIDFQDARKGPLQYDLVSLLQDSYVNLSQGFQKQVFDYYIEQANKHLSRVLDLNHFETIFRLQTFQRCFKACGSFASFFNLSGDQRYLRYLGKTLKTVVTEAEYFENYKAFTQFVFDGGLLEQDFIQLAQKRRSQ